MTRAILFLSASFRAPDVQQECQHELSLLCWNGPMSDVARKEEASNNNHEETERSAENFHERVKGDMGTWKVNSEVCKASVAKWVGPKVY